MQVCNMGGDEIRGWGLLTKRDSLNGQVRSNASCWGGIGQGEHQSGEYLSFSVLYSLSLTGGINRKVSKGRLGIF